MIAARIGEDFFAIWRTPHHPELPVGLRALRDSDGSSFIMLACARLRSVRVCGLPFPGSPLVAAWLIPVLDCQGRIGNWFCAASSNAPLVVAAYRALGVPAAAHRGMRVHRHGCTVDGVRITCGEAVAQPACPWFAADRCGYVAGHCDTAPGRGQWRRLPLAKRSWHYRERTVQISGTHPRLHRAVPVAAIDCSNDLACWGFPRQSVHVLGAGSSG